MPDYMMLIEEQTVSASTVSAERDTVLDEFIFKASGCKDYSIEKRIKLLVRPKPKLIPKRLWMWLVSKILIVEEKCSSG